MGLALLAWAIYFSMRRRQTLSGVLLGLAISAQLSMAIPAIGVLSALLLITRSIRRVAPAAILTAAVAILISGAPMHTATLASFNPGYATLRESLYSLVFPSTTNRGGLFVIPNRSAVEGEIAAVLAIAVFIAVQTAAELRRKRSMQVLAAVAFLTSAALVMVAHYAAGMNYPVDRTGLYLIFLFGLAWPIAAAAVHNDWHRRLHMIAACLLTIQFAAQFDPSSFRVWRFDRDTKQVARLVAAACASKPDSSVKVSALWINQQALEYYRRTLPIPALQPVELQDPPPLAGYDFYVLNRADAPPIGNYRVLYTGAESGIILAAAK